MLTNKELALAGIAVVSLVLAIGLISNMQMSAAQLVDNSTDAIIVPETEPSEIDILLEQANTTWIAVSGLISTVSAIIVYILNAIRSRTGDLPIPGLLSF